MCSARSECHMDSENSVKECHASSISPRDTCSMATQHCGTSPPNGAYLCPPIAQNTQHPAPAPCGTLAPTLDVCRAFYTA